MLPLYIKLGICEDFFFFLRSFSLHFWLNQFSVKVSSRSSHPEVFLRKGVVKICSKFIGEQPSRGVISIKLQSNFIEIALRHGYSPGNLLHIFKRPFPRNISGWLLLEFCKTTKKMKPLSVTKVYIIKISQSLLLL